MPRTAGRLQGAGRPCPFWGNLGPNRQSFHYPPPGEGLQAITGLGLGPRCRGLGVPRGPHVAYPPHPVPPPPIAGQRPPCPQGPGGLQGLQLRHALQPAVKGVQGPGDRRLQQGLDLQPTPGCLASTGLDGQASPLQSHKYCLCHLSHLQGTGPHQAQQSLVGRVPLGPGFGPGVMPPLPQAAQA